MQYREGANVESNFLPEIKMTYALNKKYLATSLAVLLGAFAGAASAQQQSPLYVGISAGQAKYDFDFGGQVRSGIRQSDGFNVTSTSADDSDTGYKLTVGYTFLPWLSLEADYVNLGKVKTSYAFASTNGLDTFTRSGTYKVSGVNIAAVASTNVHETISLYGKIGLLYSKYEYSESGANVIGFQPSPIPPTHSFTAPDLKRSKLSYGVGVDWHLQKNMSLRFGWDRYTDIGNDFNNTESGNGKFENVDLLSAGLIVRF